MSFHKNKDLEVSSRVLLGPGPSMASPRVLRAMATPLLGHLDPEFLALMEEEQELLRAVFQTQNKLTLTVPGTGSAGMEAALCNLIEPGDAILVAVMGFFGERLCEMAARYGAQVDRLEQPWGEVFDPAEIAAALAKKRYKLVALVVLDTVTSLGGIPVEIDAWGVDMAYSGTQKCLSCPPGLAPLTASPLAEQAMAGRRSPVANWYLDLTGLRKYWEAPHAYHHTAPISLHYALREGLRMALEEGLENRFTRHRLNAELLWEGLEALDLPPLVPPANRLTTLTTPQIPLGVDDLSVRRRLLDDFNIEIASGFGQLKGKVWRVGLMGFSSRRENVTLLLAALEAILE